jgi:drug/metabolite transporter (DMT)-like permease
MAIGLLLAFGTALATGVASVLQALAARARALKSDQTAADLHRLFLSPTYLAGTALDVVGFGCFVTALHWLPLFLVQCAATASVGVTAVLGRFWLGTRLHRWQLVTLLGLAVGLVLLAAGARAHAAAPMDHRDQWWLVVGAVGAALIGVVVGRGTGSRSGGAMAAVAGLAFAGTGVASRALSTVGSVHDVVAAPASYSLLVFGATGMVLFAGSLQKSAVTTATAALFGIETLAASAVGLAVLGDATRRGWAPPTALGFVVTLSCAVALALSGDTENRPSPPCDPGGADSGGDVSDTAGASDQVVAEPASVKRVTQPGISPSTP